MKNKKNKQENLQENRVIVENGEVKLILNDQRYLDIEESRRLVLDMVEKIYALHGKKDK